MAAETIAAGSKSFAAAARLFDPATRRSAMLLYAWCRHCDDTVDGQELGHRPTIAAAAANAASAEARLATLRRDTEAALAGNPPSHPAFQALAEVAARHHLPPALVLSHLDGYAMDVAGRTYRTEADLLEYCYAVAGAVGVMMARVMGVSDESVLDRACDLGLAFQLTNIARDIVEDAENGRVYLPAEWLAEAGVPADAVAAPENRAAIASLAQGLIVLAEPYYASALVGLKGLPLRSAWAVATANGVYREIGLRVVAKGPAAWDARISTSKAAKLRHVARGYAAALASRIAPEPPRAAKLWTRPR
ncbi:phytoene/squalene synthase family protein [Mangrovicella endophytica]|uniref:phytoene/squalene synthase family protein n=1 Tax=Mangrovicella endophytica TaxID=2066697 RepID=UPI000C9E3F0E|nr:phytoene/squalene synthase family protein [Mangrovicella endophytica]